MQEFLAHWEQRLAYFTTKWLSLYPSAPVEALILAERRLQCQLSPQNRAFLQTHNGARLLDISVHGVQLPGLRRIPRGRDMVYWTLCWRGYEPWPKQWLILANDAFGNYFVADLNTSDANGEYSILHVDHETLTATSMQPYASTFFGLLERLADQADCRVPRQTAY